uniref:Uncharacterized protein n=1 Tax=Tetranychus urticae TaxID=32264 RepID=T1KG34_TETUR
MKLFAIIFFLYNFVLVYSQSGIIPKSLGDYVNEAQANATKAGLGATPNLAKLSVGRVGR